MTARLQERTREPVADWGTWLATDARALDLFLGARSALEPSAGNRRWLPVDDLPWQPAETAGTWLAECWRRQRGRNAQHPFRRQAQDVALLDRRPPVSFGGEPLSGDWAVVDLTAAYWTIYRVTTMDVTYDPARGTVSLGRLEWLGVDDPELADDKAARNCVIGCCRRRRRLRCTRGIMAWEASASWWLQPHLWALIQDTLTAVAWEAVEDYGAVAVATDGFILPANRAADWQAALVARWSLRSHIVAQGPGEIRGPSRWTVGDVTRGRTGTGCVTPAILRPMPAGLREAIRQSRAWMVQRRPLVGSV